MNLQEKRLMLGIVILLVVVYGWKNQEVEEKKEDVQVVVTHVVDGDTVKVQMYGKERRVRLLGVDAPEVKTEECYSGEATEALQAFVEGKKVLLEKERNIGKDKYGRLLRYVQYEGKDVGLVLVRAGFAQVFEDEAVRKKKLYRQAEAEARAHQRGLWGACGARPGVLTSST